MARVQAICDYVHGHIAFGYKHARLTKTAWEAFNESTGVCRDYATLRSPCWFEAYLGDHRYTFDPRNNVPRIGRIPIGHGRDAADVPITLTFGPNTLSASRSGPTRSARLAAPDLAGSDGSAALNSVQPIPTSFIGIGPCRLSCLAFPDPVDRRLCALARAGLTAGNGRLSAAEGTFP